MGWLQTAAKRYYARLLHLYPRDFQAEYGGEMERFFDDRVREESAARLLWGTTVDALRTAPKEHFSMLLQDIRYALRAMRKNPGFAFVAALSLALGIGATTSIFSFADALLLRPLPIPDASRVVAVRGRSGGIFLIEGVSYRDYVDYRDRNRSFDGLTAFTYQSFGFTSKADGLPQMRLGMLVTGNFFETLKVPPVVGRAFRADEDSVPGRDAVLVLSHETWESDYGSNRDAIGRKVRVNGIEFTIIGVAPESFKGIDQFQRPSFYIPVHMAPRMTTVTDNSLLESRDQKVLEVKGRLKPGISKQSAEADLGGICAGLAQQYPKTNANNQILVRTELENRVERSPPDAQLVTMLMVMAALVLLIACANVANLLMSRAKARSREIAVRLAIGAGRTRLVRQLLTESLMLSFVGAVLSLGFSWAGMRFLEGLQVPTDIPFSFSFHMDQRMLLFSLAAATISAVLFGLVPALQTVRTDLIPALKAGDSGQVEKRRATGRNILVVAQVALSLVLLVTTAMMYSGFERMLLANPGFKTTGILMMGFDPSLVRYTKDQTREFYRTLSERARALPGVKSATLTYLVPMGSEGQTSDIAPEGFQFPKGIESESVFSNTVDQYYFDTLGVPLLRGRGFLETDKPESPRVAVVNEELAKRFWPKQDPLGKRFRLDGKWVQIVGVAKTGKYNWVAEPPTPFLYLSVWQDSKPRMRLMVEGAGDASALATPLRELIRSIDPNQPVYGIRTMDELFKMRAINVPRMIVQMVGTMGVIGLGLAMVGLYGLVAYSVSRRTREIGIRMAIGAGKGDVVRMVLRQGLTLAGIGILIGLVGSYAMARALEAVFTGVNTGNPVVYVVVPIALLAVTMFATYLPARRASMVDPTSALRFE